MYLNVNEVSLEINLISWASCVQLPLCNTLLAGRRPPAARTALQPRRRRRDASPRPPVTHEYNLRYINPNKLALPNVKTFVEG